MIGPLGGSELLIILTIVVLLFGSSAIPKVARSIGLAKKEFEKGSKKEAEEKKDVVAEIKKEKED